VATEVVNKGDKVPALKEETVAFETLQLGQPIPPVALRVMGLEADMANVPVAAGSVMVFEPAIAVAMTVMFPLVDPGKIAPTLGNVKALAAEKSQAFPVAMKGPAFEFVAAVSELQAVDAVVLAVNVSVVTPPTMDGVMVIFVPATKFEVNSCVWPEPLTWSVW
jgi:hypothetical protein